MKPVVFRADGSSYLGMGHIMRCLAFAEGLRKLGAESWFVIKAQDQQVTDVVRSKGCEVREIPPGISLDGDSRLTREIAEDAGAGVLVTDICHRDTQSDPEGLNSYHQKVGLDRFVVGIAGDEVIDLPANVVVAPYFGMGNESRFNDIHSEMLKGPAYFIFRPEFVAVAQSHRSIRRQANRILVTVGGSDELHLSSVILNAISKLFMQDLSVKVVIGGGYTQKLREDVTTTLGEFGGESEVVEHDANLAEMMLWADLAITGDGLTKYETAVTGTPSIMVCRPDRKVKLNQEFASAGSTMYLGYDLPLEPAGLSAQIQGLMKDLHRRQDMSEKGKSLVDGKGLDRIISAIPRELLR